MHACHAARTAVHGLSVTITVHERAAAVAAAAATEAAAAAAAAARISKHEPVLGVCQVHVFETIYCG